MDEKLLFQSYPFGQNVPIGWEISPLGQIIDSIRPRFASGKHNIEGDGVIHLRPMNISPEGKIDITDVRYVSPTQ